MGVRSSGSDTRTLAVFAPRGELERAGEEADSSNATGTAGTDAGSSISNAVSAGP